MQIDIIDLDSLFDPKGAQETIVETTQPIQVNWDEILTEWSYRLPKGYPTVIDGKFTEYEEVKILNEILDERGLSTLPSQIVVNEVVTVNQLSSNPTDVKEAFVCLFADAELRSPGFFDLYRKCLDKNLSPSERKKTTDKVKSILNTTATSYGKNYGIAGYGKMAEFTAQALSNIKQYKADVIILNNGVGAADTVIAKFAGILKAGLVKRDEFFEAIRKHAVELINTNYQIKGYFPDNWCPGDIYFVLDQGKANKALQTKQLNIGANSLNNYFYGSSNTKAPILAVSLKMQKAQAGKGTTFIKNVVVDGVTPQDKAGKDVGNQQVIKFRDVKRRLNTYYFDKTDWKKNPATFAKVRQSVVQLSKFVNLPNAPLKTNEVKELTAYLTKNQSVIQKAVDTVSKRLEKTINTATTFQQAYTRFVNNLKAMKIEKVEGNSADFLKSIEAKNKQGKQGNQGKLDTAKLQEILSQKAATYDLASTLVEKWTEKTKKVSPAFAEYLTKVKNPFIAITLFAIAQHGLNPNFYKAVGQNNASTGTLSEFPSNSVVDEKKSISKLKVVDSPGQAGFYIEYLLTINNHTYRTTLTFRFSKDQIRVEVEELAEV